MRLSMLRSSSLGAWPSLLLVFLLVGRGCDTHPLVQELDSLEKAIETSQEGRQANPSSGLVGVLMDRPGIASDSKTPKRSWGASRPVVDGPSHGEPHAEYDDQHWGEYLSVSSSSSELATDFSEDYDPLGGGTFVSEVLDPSITHTFYGSAASDTESSTGSKWMADHPSAGQALSPASDNDFQQVDPVLTGSDTDLNSLKSQQVSEDDLIREDGEADAQNELNRHNSKNHREDTPVGNLLSAVLTSDEEPDSAHRDTGGFSLEVSQSVAGQSQKSSEIRADSLPEAVKEREAISDTVAVEKAAGTFCTGTSDRSSLNGITEDDVIDDFVDWLLFLLDRLMERKERNSHLENGALKLV